MAAIKLHQAIELVEKIEDAVESEDLDSLENICRDEALADTSSQLFSDAVDRRIKADYALKYLTKMAEDLRDKWARKVKTLKKSREHLQKDTIFHILFNPEIEFKGSLGKLGIQNNGGKAALKLHFETEKLSEVIADRDILKYQIPKECYETVSVNVLKKDKLHDWIMKNSDEDLEPLNTELSTVLANNKAGKISRGRHIRVRL